MKTYLFMLLVLTGCASVVDHSRVEQIQWQQLEHLNASQENVYTDPDTERVGNLVKMYVLFDYKTPQQIANISPLSSVEQIEFDCTEGELRSVYIAYYPEHMANGKMLFEHDLNYNFVEAEEDTLYGDMLEEACAETETEPSVWRFKI